MDKINNWDCNQIKIFINLKIIYIFLNLKIEKKIYNMVKLFGTITMSKPNFYYIIMIYESL